MSVSCHSQTLLSAAIITSTLLYMVNWEAESEKAKSLVLKADLAEALLAEELDEEDSFDPPVEQGLSYRLNSVYTCLYL